MKIGMTGGEDTSILALECNGRWMDFRRAHSEHLNSLGEASRAFESIFELIAAGKLTTDFLSAVVKAIEQAGRIDEFTIEAPKRFSVPYRPGKIVALGRNYLAHAQETGHDAPTEPILFYKSPTGCVGDGDDVVVRSEFGRVDHEAELALVIGRPLKNIEPGEARDAVAGYTMLNDVTARAMQAADTSKGHPWFRSKNLDTFCPVGPVIVLPGAMGWPVEVDIELRVNGEVRQQSNTSKFIFKIPEMLAYISKFMTLETGDMVTTGTPEGISEVHPGDVMEVRIPEIGVLRSVVVSGD